MSNVSDGKRSKVENGAIPYEEVKTAFTILPHQFSTSTEKTKTQEFLAALNGVVSLVGLFGKVFAPIIYDMNNNIKNVTITYEKDIANHEYLEDMLLAEKEGGGSVAMGAVLWLRRGLHFIGAFFQGVVDDTLTERCSLDLIPFLKNAYSETLEAYHWWLGTQLTNVLSRFLPNRTNFILILALERHNRESQVIRDMQSYTDRMMVCVRRLDQFYNYYDLDD